VTYGTAGALRDKIRKGEAFDAALLPTPFMDPLVTQGAVVSGSVTVVVRSLISVGVRAGSPKPDISTVVAFKNAMLGAKSISYADPSQGGGSGIQVARVLEALGISEIMKPKTTLVPGAVDLVAAGEAELAPRTGKTHQRGLGRRCGHFAPTAFPRASFVLTPSAVRRRAWGAGDDRAIGDGQARQPDHVAVFAYAELLPKLDHLRSVTLARKFGDLNLLEYLIKLDDHGQDLASHDRWQRQQRWLRRPYGRR
jgi:hypothetical protein